MNNLIKCKDLFSFEGGFFQKLFSDYEYPWQILPHIRSIIEVAIREGLEGYSPLSDNVLVGEGVRIDKSASICGPCIIGHRTEVRHGAYIRGAVIIGDDCVIGNSSEIKNSIIMDKAQVPHFNYVGDSILGHRAHLGAGAICSNLRSDKQEVMIRESDRVISTGLKKLGAIIGDGVEVGCGAVLCPGTVICRRSCVYPLTMTRGVYPEDSIIKGDGSVVARHKQ